MPCRLDESLPIYCRRPACVDRAFSACSFSRNSLIAPTDPNMIFALIWVACGPLLVALLVVIALVTFRLLLLVLLLLALVKYPLG